MTQQSQKEYKFTLHKNLHINVYSSSIHNQPKLEISQMSFSGGADKLLRIPSIMKYYAAMKKNDLLIHAMTWMNLKGIKLGESYRLHDSIDMTLCTRQSYGDREQIWGVRV